MRKLQMKLQNKLAILFFIFLLCLELKGQREFKNMNLMPIPSNIELTNNKFKLDNSFQISINNQDERIFRAAIRIQQRIAGRTGLFFLEQFPEHHEIRHHPKSLGIQSLFPGCF